MTSHDVTCMLEVVLFNNIIIFVILFGKTAKLLLSIMICVEDSLILVTSLHKDKICVRRLRNEFRLWAVCYAVQKEI